MRETEQSLSQFNAGDFPDNYWLREIAIQLAHLNDTLDVLYDDHRNVLRVAQAE